MRWMWIDRIIELVPRQRIVTIKSVSLAEEHLHDHFAPAPGRPALPVMPASLLIEGMAQSGGVLVGHAEGFREKVVLAKVSLAEFDADVAPGQTVRYTCSIQQMDTQGAATTGLVERLDHAAPERGYQPIGRVDLIFSHVDQSMGVGTAGLDIPAHNFVFGETFKTLLRLSGVALPPGH